MPFRPVTTLPTDRVTVLLKGLLILEAEGSSCRIGVNKITDDHFLLIEIRGRAPGATADFLVSRHVGPLGQDFTISVDPPLGQSGGVFDFQGDNAPFDRSKANKDTDFRWRIDLHDRQYFHQFDLKKLSVGVEPSVVVTDATFYSHQLTSNVSAVGNGITQNLYKLASIIGAIMNVDEAHCVKIESGGTRLTLPRFGDPTGTSYIVSVRNEPTAIGSKPDPDELKEYYEVLRKKQDGTIIPSAERFRIVRTFIVKNTDPVPCMPIVLGP